MGDEADAMSDWEMSAQGADDFEDHNKFPRRPERFRRSSRAPKESATIDGREHKETPNAKQTAAIPCPQCPVPTACIESGRCATAEMPETHQETPT